MSVQAAAREPMKQAGLGSLVRTAHHKGRRREMEDLVGFGGGEKGEGRRRRQRRRRRRRDRGVEGRETQPRALSGFLLPGSKPSTFLQTFTPPGERSASHLPATEVRTTPARPFPPLGAHPDPLVPSCSLCTERGAVLGSAGSGMSTRLLWAPSLLPLRTGALDSLPVAFQVV